MIVRFHRAAEIDLEQAFTFYEMQRRGLGSEFLVELSAALKRIEEYPDAWQYLAEGVRRCRLHHFPYALIYTMGGGDILVIAVAHLHRRPDHWRDRLTQ